MYESFLAVQRTLVSLQLLKQVSKSIGDRANIKWEMLCRSHRRQNTETLKGGHLCPQSSEKLL